MLKRPPATVLLAVVIGLFGLVGASATLAVTAQEAANQGTRKDSNCGDWATTECRPPTRSSTSSCRWSCAAKQGRAGVVVRVGFPGVEGGEVKRWGWEGDRFQGSFHVPFVVRNLGGVG